MATYCFKCRTCGAQFTGLTPGDAGELNLPCASCGGPIARDYKAEGVGIGAGVRVSRDGTASEMRDLFLPTNDDLKGPGDPDGTKGMREWRENHQPKEAVSTPMWPGEVERQVW